MGNMLPASIFLTTTRISRNNFFFSAKSGFVIEGEPAAPSNVRVRLLHKIPSCVSGQPASIKNGESGHVPMTTMNKCSCEFNPVTAMTLSGYSFH
jgi:hypothetical protein